MLPSAVVNFFANWFCDAAADNRLLIVLDHAIGDKINTLPMIARVSALLWPGISH